MLVVYDEVTVAVVEQVDAAAEFIVAELGADFETIAGFRLFVSVVDTQVGACPSGLL